MKTKLLKIIIQMSKLTIYVMVVVQSLSLAMATDSNSQRRYFEDISIEVSQSASSRDLVDLIDEIESMGEFKFAYSKFEIRRKTVKVSGGKWNMKDLLKEISTQAGLSIRRINESIALKVAYNSDVLPDVLENVTAKQNVKGRVIDETGSGLPGATVIEKGTSNGTVTDMDGNFSIAIDANATLIFSFVGYLTQEVAVGGRSILNIEMVADTESLEEVVVIGYGTVKRSDLTGSVSTIKSEDITTAGTISLDQALAGRAPGVVVTQNSGAPGAGASIRIRGVSSLRGTEPLYVIDGVPMENTSLSSLSSTDEAGGNISPLSTINPSNIKSVEILKDASATAVYGSRGANGVILITTKSGQAGKGVIDVSVEFGVMDLPRKAQMQDANEFQMTRIEANFNQGNFDYDSLQSNPVYDSARNGLYETVDWQDYVFRQGKTENYDVGLSGGNENVRYRISNNYFTAKGIVQETDIDRWTTNLNVNGDISDRLTVGAGVNFALVNSSTQNTNTNSVATSGQTSIIRRALKTSPLTEIDNNVDDDTNFINYTPAHALEANDYQTRMTQVQGNLNAQYKIIEGLSIQTRASYQGRFSEQNFYQKDIFPESAAIGRGGEAQLKNSTVRLITTTNTINFNKTLGNHQIDAVLGQSAEWFETSSLKVSNAGYANDLLTFYAPQTAELYDPDQVGFSNSRLLSYFGRVNYSYNSKLLLTLTGRYDGSSKFATNNKFGFFPAMAVAYKLTEEQFIKNIQSISTLKLRGSYGVTGNQAIQPYQSLNQLTASQVVMGDGAGGEGLTPVYFVSQLPNDNLQWERTTQLNVGLDLGLFTNRITATIDYYKKLTNELLVVGNKIPSHSGFTEFTENLGAMETVGWDLGLNADIIDRSNLTWSVGVNVSTGKTIITDLGDDYILSGYDQGSVSGGTQRLVIGEGLGTFYGYATDGISQFDDFVEFADLSDQERIDLYNSDPMAVYTPVTDEEGNGGVVAERPGEQLFVDTNEDGIIDELDRTIIGNAQADFMVGISNKFSYKGFELSFFIDGQFGQDIANVSNFGLLSFGGGQQLSEARKAWSPENPSDVYPRLGSNDGNFRFSDRFIEDGSFIRLQSASIGYNLPPVLLERVRVQGMRIYLSGFNLLILTDYTGFSPDISLNGGNPLQLGHDHSGYPVPRTFRFGVNIKI